jgi:ATP-dependent DNA helicase RecQ
LYQEAGRAGRDRQKASCTIIVEDEELENLNDVQRIFEKNTSVEELNKIYDKACPPGKFMQWTGKDVYKQLSLLKSGMSLENEDIDLAGEILSDYAKPGKEKVILIPKRFNKAGDLDGQNRRIVSCEMLEKTIYHLSLIGVVEDWTIQGMRDSSAKICVDFADYTDESIEEALLNAIRNYHPDFILNGKSSRDDFNEYAYIWMSNEKSVALKAYRIYLRWYYENIIYARRQALKTVQDLCASYDSGKPEEFKRRMEAYFRFDTATKVYEKILDNPDDKKYWYEVLSPQFIKVHGIKNLIMQLSRFLESSRTNVGLNYVMGILRILDNTFEDSDGRVRIADSIRELSADGDDTWEDVYKNTYKLITELSESDLAAEQMSEVFIENVQFADAPERIYEISHDNYSLHLCLMQALSQLYRSGKEVRVW